MIATQNPFKSFYQAFIQLSSKFSSDFHLRRVRDSSPCRCNPSLSLANWHITALSTLHNLLIISGESEIRTHGGVTLNGFQDHRIKPLCHLSKFLAEGGGIQPHSNEHTVFKTGSVKTDWFTFHFFQFCTYGRIRTHELVENDFGDHLLWPLAYIRIFASQKGIEPLPTLLWKQHQLLTTTPSDSLSGWKTGLEPAGSLSRF